MKYDASTFRVEDLVREGLFADATEQHKKNQCYPTASNLAGQQMDTASLRRAWEYGLRLLVVLAVDSEFLCATAHLRAGSCLTDRTSIENQLRAARELEANIDVAAGGPGLGWYRLVYTPAEARSVSQAGKLAVVLGVEAANAFGCVLASGGTVKGVPNIFGSAPDETRWTYDCGDPPSLEGRRTPWALAHVEHYWNLGARHFFPIHNLNGQAGGTALSIPLLHAIENPSRLNQGGIFNRVPDIDRTIISIRPGHSAWACGGGFEFDGGRCNATGLSDTGVAIVKMLAELGAVIDIDHMSLKAKGRFWKETGEYYPVVSSHTGIEAINHGDKDNEGQLTQEHIDRIIKWGGAFAPILRSANSTAESETFPGSAVVARHTCGGTIESFVQAYRYLVAQLSGKTTAFGRPVIVGVGFGSDFNGLAGWPEPRFGRLTLGGGGIDVGKTLKSAFVGDNVTPRPGRCYAYLGEPPPDAPPRVQYPFTSPVTGMQFDRSSLPWSGRSAPYDVSYDGVAHVGMVADMVEEMRVLGLTDAELVPLWHGAEAYIRMWEQATGFSNIWTGESQLGIEDQCRGLRAELLSPTGPQAEWFDRRRSALADMRATGCFGAS